MNKLIILGAGTAGTTMASHLKRKLKPSEWEITIIDQRKEHYYQPGFLFVPFGLYKPSDTVRDISRYVPSGVNLITSRIEKVIPGENLIELDNGSKLSYDILIVATGAVPSPDEVTGMNGPEWYKSVFDFYTYEGAVALSEKLKNWEGGKLVVHLVEMPIKCPVAPLEFAFLADSYFKKRGMREKVEITYVTPLSGPFTKPKSNTALNYLMQEKNISIISDFAISEVDNDNKKIVDWGGEEVPFDLLVTVPTNKGDELWARSGMGDDLNFIPTDKHTLRSKDHENIFVIGDATNVPASKAGSVAHFEADILTENIMHYIKGEALQASFDGHSNCFIETGHGKALLIDFNYDHEPVPGTFPIPGIGPLKMLKEKRVNHWGKLAFRWVYWNMLLKGIPIPFVPAHMRKAGKKFD
jgi:sulfide:quinone oxidoreductase